ncbi:glycosyltransferase family 2 protein [Phocaeicola sp.]
MDISDSFYKISVIIPVYNVEKYIERSVHSLLGQTLQNGIEYIFINDCTPDNSIQILQNVIKEYPMRKKDIHIINHNENCGSAAARNTGLKYAKGNYIIYCDSDDWIEADMYETLYNEAVKEDADLVGCDFEEVFGSYIKYNKQNLNYDGKNCLYKLLSGELHGSTCNKLVKRSIYQENDITFIDGINMWEDIIVSIKLFYFSKRIVYIPHAYYHYIRYNDNSYTNKLSQSALDNLMAAIDEIEFFLKRQDELLNFNKGLNYLKLSVKANLLLNSTNGKQKQWNSLYKDADKQILSYKQISLFRRIILLLASKNLFLLLNGANTLRKNIKRIFKYLWA